MKNFKIGNKIIGKGSPFFIAEVGLNHNGSVKEAKKMIQKASEAKADAVKFQTFKAENLYPKNHVGYKIFKKYELEPEDFGELQDEAKKLRIQFFSTPFDFDSVDILQKLKVPAFKIASSDLNYLPFLEYIALKKKPMIISTGMSTLKEIKNAVTTIQKKGLKEIAILHCVSGYPTPVEDANLNCIKSLKEEINLPVGFSDNGEGFEIPIMASTLGADIIEKHFTLDKKQKGADHSMSIEPDSMKKLISIIKKTNTILGDGIKKIQPSEKEIVKIARRGIYASKDLKKDNVISKQDLICLRPSNGINPIPEKIIGEKIIKNLKKGQSIVDGINQR